MDEEVFFKCNLISKCFITHECDFPRVNEKMFYEVTFPTKCLSVDITRILRLFTAVDEEMHSETRSLSESLVGDFT